jgi:hypothetical protein
MSIIAFDVASDAEAWSELLGANSYFQMVGTCVDSGWL